MGDIGYYLVLHFGIGYLIQWATYDCYESLKNPIWKPFIIVGWPVWLCYLVTIRPVARWIKSCVEYYLDKEK